MNSFLKKKMKQVRAAVIGKDGRTSAIRESLRLSPWMIGDVPRVSEWKIGTPAAGEQEVRLAIQKLLALNQGPDFVVCGPEEPLAKGTGIVDLLWNEFRIPCVGPKKCLAQLEASKSFTRRLLEKYGIMGNPKFRAFHDLRGIESYLKELEDFVVKPDGLTGGKGVKVSGEHLFSIQDALNYCKEIFFTGQTTVVIEEKLDGEEFSLQSFCDGTHVADMPIVQDHKRARDGDTGPNTGGMGSYSCEDHSMPFLTPEDVEQAKRINRHVAQALLKETGEPYKGILYGGFMATRDGVRLIEYNARFGDPEALNVLSLLKTDFVEVCQAIIRGTLDRLDIRFEKLATVCKYIVPEGYPENPVKHEPIDWTGVSQSERLRIFEAAVDKGNDGVYRLSGSRAIGFVGLGSTLQEAEQIAETAARSVKGPVFHRKDIGTALLISKRVAHMQTLRPASANAARTHIEALSF